MVKQKPIIFKFELLCQGKKCQHFNDGGCFFDEWHCDEEGNCLSFEKVKN